MPIIFMFTTCSFIFNIIIVPNCRSVCNIILYYTYIYIYIYIVSRDSVDGIATRYWLDGPGIESRSGMRFSTPVETSSGVHKASYAMNTGSFLGVKRPGVA